MSLAWPTYFLVIGIIIQTMVALYVMRTKKEGRVVWAFLLLSVAIILWQIIYIFQSNAIHNTYLDIQAGRIVPPVNDIGFNHPIAIFDRLQYFAIGMIAPSFLYLVLSMFIGVENEKDKKLRLFLFSFPAILYALNLFSISTSTPMIHTQYSISGDGLYMTTRGMTYWYNVAYGYTFIALGFSLLVFKSLKPSYALQRKQAMVFFGGTILALFGNIQAVFLPTSLNYDMTPIFMTVGSIFFAIGFLKYKMFLIEAGVEKTLGGEAAFDLSMGHGFVVYEDKPEYSLEIFADMAKHSVQGLAFVPMSPESVRRKHSLSNTPILQVGKKSSPRVLSYSSRDEMDYILYMADKFSKEASNTIIMVSGLGDMAFNMPVRTYKMLIRLKEICAKNSSRILVSIPKRESMGCVGETSTTSPEKHMDKRIMARNKLWELLDGFVEL